MAAALLWPNQSIARVMMSDAMLAWPSGASLCQIGKRRDNLLAVLLVGDLELHAPIMLRYEVYGRLAKACRQSVFPSTRCRVQGGEDPFRH